jgi:hypothetical protein
VNIVKNSDHNIDTGNAIVFHFVCTYLGTYVEKREKIFIISTKYLRENYLVFQLGTCMFKKNCCPDRDLHRERPDLGQSYMYVKYTCMFL